MRRAGGQSVRFGYNAFERHRAKPAPRKSPLFSGLTGKVLALAAIFLMVGELLVFVPSIANFRINWLKQRVAMAEIAALSVEAAEDGGCPSRFVLSCWKRPACGFSSCAAMMPASLSCRPTTRQ
jgi:hypothetical protein